MDTQPNVNPLEGLQCLALDSGSSFPHPALLSFSLGAPRRSTSGRSCAWAGMAPSRPLRNWRPLTLCRRRYGQLSIYRGAFEGAPPPPLSTGEWGREMMYTIISMQRRKIQALRWWQAGGRIQTLQVHAGFVDGIFYGKGSRSHTD